MSFLQMRKLKHREISDLFKVSDRSQNGDAGRLAQVKPFNH